MNKNTSGIWIWKLLREFVKFPNSDMNCGYVKGLSLFLGKQRKEMVRERDGDGDRPNVEWKNLGKGYVGVPCNSPISLKFYQSKK